MSAPYTRVPLREAIASLGLDQHFDNRTTLEQYVSAEDKIAKVEANPERFPGIDVNSTTWRDNFRKMYPARFDVLLYPGGTKLDGNFDMDAAAGRGLRGETAKPKKAKPNVSRCGYASLGAISSRLANISSAPCARNASAVA